MKRVLLIFLFLFASLLYSIACVNGLTRELKDGTVVSMDLRGEHSKYIPMGYLIFNSDKALKRLDSLWKTTKDVDYLSDYAVVLIFQHEYKKARDIYLKIEKIKPDQYATAANLGTAYELLGDNNNALKWIRKSVQINPASHDSSEWVHVNILEAKIKGDKFYTSDFLLKTNFGNDSIPVSALSNTELIKLSDALAFQLNERVYFTNPLDNDKIVAQLLFDLANVLTLLENKKDALAVYKIARKYGYSGPLLDSRMNYVKSKLIADTDSLQAISKPVLQTPVSESDYTLFYILGVGASILSIGGFFFFKRKK
ncbi:tetratricopeptide repeat protein [Cytophaga aurantiaca]|uniref:tetratricopeptide repeat protein n=1 Tax=Cytophaga aurantiaca TaxID=29530 RepID=UPI0004772671|nr:tetratricopeptide repeat protein [Cytophaga aurantiaca]